MQLYTVRQAMEKDLKAHSPSRGLWATRGRVRRLLHHKPPEVKSHLDRHGLKAPSTHIVMADLA